jgi:nitrite reductase/ring-hydroxylating ferredoxin subunit/uncharacterized membrane protein
MRTVANIKGHPIHAMLIPFPIAFLVGGAVCDFVGAIGGVAIWWTVGSWLIVAGLVMGVVAAVPGMIDYFYSVPPNSSARKRGGYHAIANLSAMFLFIIALLSKGGLDQAPGAVTLIANLGGIVLLTMGGWMGGTLIHRNFVGPEHRYAQAGKYKEETVEHAPGKPVKVADADELEVDQMKLLRVGGRRIVLARTENDYVAFDDRCSHRGGSLAGGVMMCGKVQCLWHGSQFDCKTGQVKAGPAKDPVKTYTIEKRDGAVHLVIEAR